MQVGQNLQSKAGDIKDKVRTARTHACPRVHEDMLPQRAW